MILFIIVAIILMLISGVQIGRKIQVFSKWNNRFL